MNLTPSDFDDNTLYYMKSRKYGAWPGHSSDAERMEIQSELVKGDGKNEPVIMTKIGGKGFGLLEGWHRTLNLLKMGRQPDGTWTPVLIRAWVGYGSN